MEQSKIIDTLDMYQQHTSHRIPAQTIKQLAPNTIKGLSIPSRLLAKVRSDRDR